MTHPCVFLIGRHGTGKSTIGRTLESEYGWHHVSLGDLGRLARRHQLPRDFPLRFVALLSGHQPGTPLRNELVEAMLRHIEQRRGLTPVSVDGFPSDVSHVALLPRDAVVVHVTLNEEDREMRLEQRSQSSKRMWTKGVLSSRDEALPVVLHALNAGRQVHEVCNKGTLGEAVKGVLEICRC